MKTLYNTKAMTIKPPIRDKKLKVRCPQCNHWFEPIRDSSYFSPILHCENCGKGIEYETAMRNDGLCNKCHKEFVKFEYKIYNY